MAVSLTCRLTRLVPAFLIVGACVSADRPTAPRSGPAFAISDGVHEGGTPGFFFLPPLVARPTFSGTFDPDITTLNPQIAICDITNGPDSNCGGVGGTAAVIAFTTTSTPAITVHPRAQLYRVNWRTRGAAFAAGHTYRVHVTAGASGARRELGFADVLLTTEEGQANDETTGDLNDETSGDLPDVTITDLIVAKDGRTLPIRFRIEAGIAGSISVSAATPSVSTGATDLLTATVQDLHGAALAGASVAWAVTAGPGVVASLAPTSGPTTLLTAGTTPGTAVVAATSAGVSATATVTVTGGAAGKSLYVGANGSASILVYAAGASGNATPIATIAGSNTGLAGTYGIALDGAGNLYVTTPSSASILVYAAGANGNVTPTAAIAGGNTGLNFPAGIALDGAGNIYVVNANYTFSGGSITVYAAGANGNATPTATITGGNTGLSAPLAIARDGAGNIYVTNQSTRSITVYAAGASGNATPVATIAGGNTGLNSPFGIALDGAGNIYVTDIGTNSINVYAAGASGNATPVATITGGNTGLQEPIGIVLDGAGNIYVTNALSNSITVYAAGASGNATPTATINTGLNGPSAITF